MQYSAGNFVIFFFNSDDWNITRLFMLNALHCRSHVVIFKICMNNNGCLIMIVAFHFLFRQ
jgi:hypothetical protein